MHPAVAEVVEALFGSANEASGGGIPGRVLLSDLRPRGVVHPVHHVSLDQFTQGPLDGHLFGEAPLYARGRSLSRDVWLTDIARLRAFRFSALPDQHLPSIAASALRRALDDLVGGTLALGSGASRGHGFFDGPPPRWSGPSLPTEQPS